jgi:4-hydroxy-3-polyprenylbenzoate decarboxylase
LGLDPATDDHTIVEAIAAALRRPVIPPRNVGGAPCQEIVLQGEDVDLDRLPGFRE